MGGTCSTQASVAHFTTSNCEGTATWVNYNTSSSASGVVTCNAHSDASEGETTLLLPESVYPVPYQGFDAYMYPLGSATEPTVPDYFDSFSLTCGIAPLSFAVIVGLGYDGSLGAYANHYGVVGKQGTCIQFAGGNSMFVDCSGGHATGSLASGLDYKYTYPNDSYSFSSMGVTPNYGTRSNTSYSLVQYDASTNCLADTGKPWRDYEPSSCHVVHRLSDDTPVFSYNVTCESQDPNAVYHIATFGDDACGGGIQQTYKGQRGECAALPGVGVSIAVHLIPYQRN